jgi:hypothetical protein
LRYHEAKGGANKSPWTHCINGCKYRRNSRAWRPASIIMMSRMGIIKTRTGLNARIRIEAAMMMASQKQKDPRFIVEVAL